MANLKALLALFLLGCASSTTPDAFRPEGFSAHQIDLIDSAAAEWTTNGFPVLIDPTCPADVCSTIRLVDQIEAAKASIDGLSIGEQDEQGILGICNVTIDDGPGLHMGGACANAYHNDNAIQYDIQILKTDNDYGKDPDVEFRTTVLHELGHTRGKVHIGEGNVMNLYSGPTQADHLTAADLADGE